MAQIISVCQQIVGESSVFMSDALRDAEDSLSSLPELHMTRLNPVLKDRHNY